MRKHTAFLWTLLLALLLFLFAAPVLNANQAAEKARSQTEQVLIKGLDGGEYQPYHPALVTRVQEALKTAGLYQGEISGKLDEETMQALGEFQKQNGLGVTGIPTPKTRALLLKPPVS